VVGVLGWWGIIYGMSEQTPYQQLRQMEMAINRFGISADMDMQSTAGRRSFEALKRDARLARDMLKDYEMFELEEDSRKQMALLPRVIRCLEKLRSSMLKASEYDLISAIDIAQLSSQLDELMDKLK
jgi:hypothetical protein